MRHLAAAVVLACVLSGAARAGEIPTSDRTTPPPPPKSVMTTGDIPMTGGTTPQASDTLLTIIVMLLSIGR